LIFRRRAPVFFLCRATHSAWEGGSPEEGADDETETEDEESGGRGGKKEGLTLIFDVVRRCAQPMGIHLPEWEGRIIDIEKGIVRLLPVQARAEQLFGEDGAAGVAERIESGARRDPQMVFDFIFDAAEQAPRVRGRGERSRAKASSVRDEDLTARRSATTLDRVHAAMLLQAAGRASALRTFVHSEMDRGPEFLRLANALSALYPKDSEEKRLLDAMLLAVPR
jgi:putative DNA methylase